MNGVYSLIHTAYYNTQSASSRGAFATTQVNLPPSSVDESTFIFIVIFNHCRRQPRHRAANDIPINYYFESDRFIFFKDHRLASQYSQFCALSLTATVSLRCLRFENK